MGRHRRLRFTVVGSIVVTVLAMLTLIHHGSAAAQQPPPTPTRPAASPAAVGPVPSPTVAPAVIPSPAPLDVWVPFGPAEGQATLAVSPDFRADRTLLVGTVDRAYLSIDAGATWTDISDALQHRWPPGDGQHRWSFTFSPTFAADKTVFAAGTAGVMRSVDGGKTWSTGRGGELPVCPTCPASTRVYVSPTFDRDKTVFLPTFAGLFRSTDGGAIYQRVGFKPLGAYGVGFGGGPLGPFTLALSPSYADDQTLLLGTDVLLLSTDGGENWIALPPKVAGEFAKANPVQPAFSPLYRDDQTLFLVANTLGFERSTNGGETWTGLSTGSTGPGGSECFSASHLSFSPNYIADGTVYISGLVGQCGPRRFSVAGEVGSWLDVDGLPEGRIGWLGVLPTQPGTVLVSTDNGLHARGDAPLRRSILVTPEHPLSFASQDASYHRHQLNSGWIKISGEAQLQVALEVRLQEGAPADSSSGLVLDDGKDNMPEGRQLALVYQSGGWNLLQKRGREFVLSERLATTPNMSGQFSLVIGADGRSLTVGLSDGQERRLTLPDSLYAVRDVVRLVVQTGPLSEVRIPELSFPRP